MTSPHSDDVEVTLTNWAEEALNLRHGEIQGLRATLPHYEEGQQAVVSMIQHVRVRLDRVEELQSRARQVKGRLMRSREAADFEASLAYDQAMQTNRNTRVQDFVTGAEKNADAALASFDQRRAAHQMKRRESVASEVLDVITQCYWGLEKLREELLQMLKLQTYLTTEETQTQG